MARPIPTAKASVNLASNPASNRAFSAPRASRIRRDPPPVAKQKIVLDPEERDQWAVIVGILAFALAIFAIILGFSSYSARSAQDHPIEVTIGD